MDNYEVYIVFQSSFAIYVTGLNDKIQDLEETSAKLTEFDDCCKNVNTLLKKLEDKMETHNKLGSSAKDPKHQDKISVCICNVLFVPVYRDT